MKFMMTEKNGRVIECTKAEKQCKFCKSKDKPLTFSEVSKCLVCQDCELLCKGAGVESMFFVIDKWVITNKEGEEQCKQE